MLLAVEGPAFAGKSTLCRSLSQSGFLLVDLEDTLAIDPLALAVQKLTRGRNTQLSKEEELFLYATRLARKAKIIESFQASGQERVLLVDRFSLSLEIFFQVARVMDHRILESITYLATRGKRPDAVIFLDVSLATALARERSGPRRRSPKFNGMESYFEDYRTGFLVASETLPEPHLVINTDRLQPNEVSARVSSWMTNLLTS